MLPYIRLPYKRSVVYHGKLISWDGPEHPESGHGMGSEGTNEEAREVNFVVFVQARSKLHLILDHYTQLAKENEVENIVRRRCMETRLVNAQNLGGGP